LLLLSRLLSMGQARVSSNIGVERGPSLIFILNIHPSWIRLKNPTLYLDIRLGHKPNINKVYQGLVPNMTTTY
jgi:hypothetical protein